MLLPLAEAAMLRNDQGGILLNEFIFVVKNLKGKNIERQRGNSVVRKRGARVKVRY